MNHDDWFRDAQRLLNDLQMIDFGYPLDSNVIRTPDTVHSPVSRCIEQSGRRVHSLDDFYRVTDGISWPDIHVGYFLNRARTFERVPDDEPTSLTGATRADIVVVGSDGGGSLFAMALDDKRILHLPPGRVERQTYIDDGRVSCVAPDFDAFTVRLLEDLRAFVADDASHSFVV